MKELERSLLGTILKAEINDGSNALLTEAREAGISSEFFLAYDTRAMWDAMCELDSKGVILDTVSLFTHLQKGDKQIKPNEVWSINDDGLSELHYNNLVTEMVEGYRTSRLSRLSMTIKDALSEGKESEEILTSVQSQCNRISSLAPSQDTLESIVDETYKDVTGKESHYISYFSSLVRRKQ